MVFLGIFLEFFQEYPIFSKAPRFLKRLFQDSSPKKRPVSSEAMGADDLDAETLKRLKREVGREGTGGRFESL